MNHLNCNRRFQSIDLVFMKLVSFVENHYHWDYSSIIYRIWKHSIKTDVQCTFTVSAAANSTNFREHALPVWMFKAVFDYCSRIFFITMNWWLLCVGVWKCHNFLYHISLCASEERRRRGKMSNSFYFVNFVIQSNLLKLSWIWVECALSLVLWVRINFVNFLEVMIHSTLSNINFNGVSSSSR